MTDRRVLVTGSAGRAGSAIVERLSTTEWTVRTFDLVDGDDLRDAAVVDRAMRGCAAVIHAGALAHDTAGTPEEIVATNVLGTWNVLTAAEGHRVERVVAFSSGQVFGFADGEGIPSSLPVTDAHPLRAARPYGMSKRLVEEMCEIWTGRTAIPTVVLRPVLILIGEDLQNLTEDHVEFGAFVHVDDVASAAHLGLTASLEGHHRMTLCGPGPFDTSVARETLGWEPQRDWPGRLGG